MLETPRISLTINLEGSHKPRFMFDEDKGKMVRYFGRVVTHRDTGEDLFLPAKPATTKAIQRKSLSEEFVLNAINTPVPGYNKKKWGSIPKRARVNKHVRNLVKEMFDLDVIDHTTYQWEFSPEIVEL